jgi:hypothetical protein
MGCETEQGNARKAGTAIPTAKLSLGHINSDAKSAHNNNPIKTPRRIMADTNEQKQLDIVTAKLRRPDPLIPEDSNVADFIKAVQSKNRESYLSSLSHQDLSIRYRSLLHYTQTVCYRAADIRLGEQKDDMTFVGILEQINRLFMSLRLVEAHLTHKSQT